MKMNTNTQRTLTACAFAAGMMCSALLPSGCGMVSRKKYVDTAMSAGPQQEPAIYFFDEDEPAPRDLSTVRIEMPDRPVTGVRLTDADGDGIIDQDIRGLAREPDGVTTLRDSLSRERSLELSEVRSRLETLRRELQLLQVRAELKGAAGEAAVEPHARSFNTAVNMINERLNAPLDSRSMLGSTTELEILLTDAERAVTRAELAVDAVPYKQGARRP